MNKEDIDKAFENRWRIKAHLDGTGHVKGSVIPFVSSEHQEEILSHLKSICRDFFEAGLALGAREYVPLDQLKMNMETPLIKTKNDLKLFDRSIPFNQSVFNTENIQKYGQQMLQDFYEYWTEPNPSHTKMRFELQKTWDVNRRLARWARNNFNRYGNNKPTPGEQQSKLADILVG